MGPILLKKNKIYAISFSILISLIAPIISYAQMNEIYYFFVGNDQLIYENIQNKKFEEAKRLINEGKYFDPFKLFDIVSRGLSKIEDAHDKSQNKIKSAQNRKAIEFVHYLIKNKNMDPNTLISLALKNGISHVALDLIKHPQINLNIQNDLGETALMIAIDYHQIDSIKKIISHPQLNPNIKNKLGKTALMIAVEGEQIDLVRVMMEPIFLQKFNDPENRYQILKEAISKENIQMAKLLFDQLRLDLSIKGPDGNKLLEVAILNDNIKMAKLILDQPTYQVNRLKSEGLTNFMDAIRKERFDIAEAIINHPEFDPNVLTNVQESAAMWVSTIEGNYPVLKKLMLELINKGAFLSIKDVNQKTVIDYLYDGNHGELIKQINNSWIADINDPCDQNKFRDHITFGEELINKECPICTDKIEKGAFKSPGGDDCECVLCPKCNSELLENIKKNSGASAQEALRCPCRKEIKKSFIEVSNTMLKKDKNDPEDILNLIEIADRIHSQRLSKIKNFKNCLTNGCIGGRSVGDDESLWYSCPLCEGESFLMGKNVSNQQLVEKESLDKLLFEGAKCPPEIKPQDPQNPQYMAGRFRPCYFCGKITERIDGCNDIKCASCNNKWHWNYGNHSLHPNYHGQAVHDYRRESMRYKPLNEPHF